MLFIAIVSKWPQFVGAAFYVRTLMKAHSLFAEPLLDCGAMYVAVTRDIRVTALPDFLPDQSDPQRERYVWSYTIEIANLGRTRVQLLSRHWIIIDAFGRREEVEGPGVVGETPVLEPGETYRYASGCPLTTPSGIMHGAYRMVTDSGETFDVEIPTFSLDSPFSNPTLN
jgi:ApaG protein